MDLMQSASAWLDGQLSASVSATVTYRRGGTGPGSLSAPINATIGKTTQQAQDSEGTTFNARFRDYLILGSSLTAAGFSLPPKAGDQIIEADGIIFEVMSLRGEDVWRWSDPYRQRLRIHTKQASGS